jgi:hypothetical protein
VASIGGGDVRLRLLNRVLMQVGAARATGCERGATRSRGLGSERRQARGPSAVQLGWAAGSGPDDDEAAASSATSATALGSSGSVLATPRKRPGSLVTASNNLETQGQASEVTAAATFPKATTGGVDSSSHPRVVVFAKAAGSKKMAAAKEWEEAAARRSAGHAARSLVSSAYLTSSQVSAAPLGGGSNLLGAGNPAERQLRVARALDEALHATRDARRAVAARIAAEAAARRSHPPK